MPELTQIQIRTAAARALLVYPGPVGRLIHDELYLYADMPWLRCSGAGSTSRRMGQLVDAVMERAVPERVA